MTSQSLTICENKIDYLILVVSMLLILYLGSLAYFKQTRKVMVTDNKFGFSSLTSTAFLLKKFYPKQGNGLFEI